MKIRGIVISGKNKSEKLGFPTINLDINQYKNEIESGVFSGKVFIEDKNYKAAIFIGLKKEILEAHILNFSGNLRGKEVEIEIGEKIRDVYKFDNDKELSSQIAKDVEKVRNME